MLPFFFILPYVVYTGHVSDNSDGKCTILYCNPGGNGLQSVNCNDTTDNGRISRCSKYAVFSLKKCVYIDGKNE